MNAVEKGTDGFVLGNDRSDVRAYINLNTLYAHIHTYIHTHTYI